MQPSSEVIVYDPRDTLIKVRNKDATVFSFSLLNVNQKTRRVQILTEMYLMRSHPKKKLWQLLKLKGPKEFLIVPLSTRAWEIFMSNSSLLSMYMSHAPPPYSDAFSDCLSSRNAIDGFALDCLILFCSFTPFYFCSWAVSRL